RDEHLKKIGFRLVAHTRYGNFNVGTVRTEGETVEQADIDAALASWAISILAHQDADWADARAVEFAKSL
ncbi:MAG: hypothetical protein AAB694_00580, partial [Patescibacteria group bacterium]